MSFAAALILAAATATAPPPAAPERGSGVQLATGQVRATIVRPVIVRQSSGVQEDRDGPAPHISRRGQTVLIEFQ